METAPQKEKDKSPASQRSAVYFLAFIIILYLAFRHTGLGHYFQRSAMETALDRMGFWAPAGFIILYAVGSLLAVPGTIMTAVGGVVFGPWLGTVLVVIGATAGACAAFVASRFFVRGYVVERFGKTPWFRKLEDGINKKGIRFVLFVRLVPVFPFNWLNYACGLTSVRFRDYLAGTFFGIIPASFVFTNAAAQVAGAASGQGIGLDFYLSLTLLGLLSAFPMIYRGEGEKSSPEE